MNDTAQILPSAEEHWSWKREHQRLAAQWNRARKRIMHSDGTLNVEFMSQTLGIDASELLDLLASRKEDTGN